MKTSRRRGLIFGSVWVALTRCYTRGKRDFCNQGRMETFGGYTDEIIAEQATRFVEADDQRPFFLFVCLTATHGPWSGHPERLVRLYDEAAFDDIPGGESYAFGEQALESLSVDRGRERGGTGPVLCGGQPC